MHPSGKTAGAEQAGSQTRSPEGRWLSGPCHPTCHLCAYELLSERPCSVWGRTPAGEMLSPVAARGAAVEDPPACFPGGCTVRRSAGSAEGPTFPRSSRPGGGGGASPPRRSLHFPGNLSVCSRLLARPLRSGIDFVLRKPPCRCTRGAWSRREWGRCRQVERGRPNPGQRVFSVTGAAEAFKLDTDLQARDPDRWAQRGPAEPVSRRLGEQGRPVAVLSLGARFLSVGTGLGWLRFPEGPPGRGGAVAHL